MQNQKAPLIILSVLLLLNSCASLTKSQLNEVCQFGQLTKSFSVYPPQVIYTLNDVHEQQQLFLVNSIINPDKHLQGVMELYTYKKENEKINEQAAVAFSIIDDYAQKLIHLTADSHSRQLDTAAEGLGGNLDNLIDKYNALVPAHAVPTGIGALFGQVISLGGDMYIRSKQAEAAKMFVTKGDTVVGSMTITLQEYLAGRDGDFRSLKAMIARERATMRTNYLIYLKRDEEKIVLMHNRDTAYTGKLSAWRAATFDADKLYIQLLNNLDADEQLRQQCLEALVCLRKAHRQLLNDLQQKKKLKEVYAELRAYGSSIGQMNAAYKKIK
jgi:hypothetical protein